MKSKAYTILCLLLLCNIKIYAFCGNYSSPKDDPQRFSIFEMDMDDESRYKEDMATVNIRDWEKYTRQKATPNDIRRVVYKYSFEQLQLIDQGVPTDSMRANTFVRYLIDSKDKEAIRFLLLAKQCEIRRFKRSDAWWYPPKGELHYEDLREIVEEALLYKGKVLKDRYLLQAIRAGVTMGDYDLCRRLWHEEFKQLPTSAVKQMAEEYLAGIEYEEGNYLQSMKHYSNVEVYFSEYWTCVSRLRTDNTLIGKLRFLYTHDPDHPNIIGTAMQIIDEKQIYVDDFESLPEFLVQAAQNIRTKRSNVYFQIASYICYLEGDNNKALEYIQKARNAKGDSKSYDYIRIFQIYLQAITGNYDDAFDANMLTQLKWLDSRIQANLTPEIIERYTDWDMFYNRGHYYYNDALRRIVLSEMVPRYIQKGRDIDALLLTGMVSERFRTLVEFRDEYKANGWSWNPDFITDIFDMMDTFPTEKVVEYAQVLENGGENAFQRYLASQCYNNQDYLKEIIGTKYIRTQEFDKAIQFLTDRNADYDTTLNIYSYFLYEPFPEPHNIRQKVDTNMNYKLNFALQMNDLQQMRHTVKSPRLKAEVTFRYALGLLRATDDCWALTKYMKGDFPEEPADYKIWADQLYHEARILIIEAFTYSNDKDFNAKWLSICLNSGFYSTSPERDVAHRLRSKYSSTDFYQQWKILCDTREDWKVVK